MSNWSIVTTEKFNHEGFSITIEDVNSFGLQNVAQYFELNDFEGNAYAQDIKDYYNNEVNDIEFVLEIPIQTGTGGSSVVTISANQIKAISTASSPKNAVMVLIDQNENFIVPKKTKGTVLRPDDIILSKF